MLKLYAPLCGTFINTWAKGENRSLKEVLETIKSGRWQSEIQRLRALTGEDYEKAKARLPAFMMSATTGSGKHAVKDLGDHSGILGIDVDKLTETHAAQLRDCLGKDPHIEAAWLSPSGRGVKAAMKVPPSLQLHGQAFISAERYLRETYSISIDPACKNANRLCFVSWDPDLVWNEGTVIELPVVPGTLKKELRGGDVCGNSSEFLNTETSSLNPVLYTLHPVFMEFPNLMPHYERLVKPLGQLQKGLRNQALVDLGSRAFFYVAPEFAIAMGEQLALQHSALFADYGSVRVEMENLLNGCLQSYPDQLLPEERNYYTWLSRTEQTAFRIARSLSTCEEGDYAPPQFHLSAQALADRMGILCNSASGILKLFVSSKLLEVVKQGTRHEKGTKGRATVYAWAMG